VTRWLPALAWAAVIFGLSSVSSLDTGLGFWDYVLRKLAHVTEYAILGALLAHALRRRDALAVGLGIAYAATDELHQHFVPGRVGAPLDVLIDGVGVLVGVAAYRRLLRRISP
jgi:VanZ family protein